MINKEWLLTDEGITNVLKKSWGVGIGDINNPQFRMVAIDVMRTEAEHMVRKIKEMSGVCNLTISAEEIRGYVKAFEVILAAIEGEQK
jgi:hypothetical protein